MIRRRGGRYSAGRPRAALRASAHPASAGIYGVGIDLLQISRIAPVHERFGERFHARLLHPLECEHLAQARSPVNYLAKCFAVKEAFVKALGTGFRGIAHHEVGWTRGPLGRAQLVYTARVAGLLTERSIGAAHLNLSDERDFVTAVVVLERRR